MSTRGSNTDQFNDELVRLNARLAILARRNLLSEAVQAEYLYRDLLNKLYGWDLRDANESRANFEAIDLVDRESKVVVQISVTCDTAKINRTLSRDSMEGYHDYEYRVKFCFIGEQRMSVKRSDAIRNPHGVQFDQKSDILLTEDLLAAFVGLDPRRQREALHVVDDAGHEGFYEWVCDQFESDTGEDLYGDVPLSECYIEPTLNVQGKYGRFTNARKWVESFVHGKGKIAVLCGEPGHGKTSLCRKAVCDFYRSGCLAGKVSNVFYFSLNPANTDALANGSLNIYKLLSWGGDRTIHDHMIKSEHCRNALVFLDAFDELLEWHPMFNLTGFMQNHVATFQEETGAHVIVTTRSMVVQPDTNTLRVSSRTRVPVVRLQPVSKKQQIGWIENYARHLRNSLESEMDTDNRKELENQLTELKDYARQYDKLVEGSDFQKVLGIPIIFRMVVAAHFLPKQGESISSIYDNLFDITWERHRHKAAILSADPRDVTRVQLMQHALRVYADDTETAIVEDALESSWLFSFYTDNKGKQRYGFLHRSFYHHFLAHEVLSWFSLHAISEDCEDTLLNKLSYLARRRLDETTLGYIREMYDLVVDKISLKTTFSKAYDLLKETDGIMPLPMHEQDANMIKQVSRLERANNVFWNVVSICSVCGNEVTVDKVSTLPLCSYRLDSCYLNNAILGGAELSGAHFGRAHLNRARFGGTQLRGADLMGTHLEEADLRGAHLEKADLRGADLEEADLRGADLEEADLRGADLEEADLRGADLRGAHLVGANLVGANLVGANLVEAHLGGARLGGARLGGADLGGAFLEEVDLRGVDLMRAGLVKAYLGDADLRRTILAEADLRGADLRGADLRGADLRGADLRGADLRWAHFGRRNELERTQLEGANLEGAVFEDVDEG